MRSVLLIGFLAPFALIACGDASQDEAPLDWGGTTPHFVARGTINHENAGFDIRGSAASSGDSVWCGREYLAPRKSDGTFDLTRARHDATEIAGNIVVNGQERSFELEIRGHSMQAEKPGAKVKIVPRVDGTPPSADAAWADWEWHSKDGLDLYEGSAQDGTFELRLFSGTPGEGGIVIPSGEGSVGGILNARWSVSESLNISFTATCAETEVEEE